MSAEPAPELPPSRTEKVSITLPEQVLREARERAGGNLSAYVSSAVERQLQHDRIGELLAEQELEHGRIPDELLAGIRAQWRTGSTQASG
ncbi:MAG: CopG family transcriptional regulator [Egibacteraceae bacterium]